MRYALNIGAGGEGRDPLAMAELAVLAEDSGWDAMLLEDYVVYGTAYGGPAPPTYDPWIVLAAMAMATTRIRLGTDVTPVPRRRPWYLAEQAVTLDHLSGGRVVLGVGAGDVHDPGFGGVGEPTDPRTRAQRLDEGLAVIDALWTGEPVEFAGTHYRVDGLQLRATPVQRPRIPIWVGGDFRLAGVRRRVSRWDGSVACVACGDDGERPLDAGEIAGLLELVRETRGDAHGFDVCVGTGERPDDWDAEREHIGTVAAAGATWWYEWIPPCDAETTTKMIARGPLRID